MIIINFFKKYPLMIFLTIFSIPLLISIFMYLPWFSYSKGNVDGWLGFWGSYLGGTMGTLGVIATTYFLIKHETEITNSSMVLEDKRKRDLMYLEIQMKKIEEITESILVTNSKWLDLHNTLIEYSVAKESFLGEHTISELELSGKMKNYITKRKILGDHQNKLILHMNTFHNDPELNIFNIRIQNIVMEYNRIFSDIKSCKDLKECINHTDKIEKLLKEFEAYDNILKFYSEQYKSIVASINQN